MTQTQLVCLETLGTSWEPILNAQGQPFLNLLNQPVWRVSNYSANARIYCSSKQSIIFINLEDKGIRVIVRYLPTQYRGSSTENFGLYEYGEYSPDSEAEIEFNNQGQYQWLTDQPVRISELNFDINELVQFLLN